MQNNQIMSHLHCQLFRQWYIAVTDTVLNVHHSGGTLVLVDDLLPTWSPTRQRRRIVVLRWQLTCRLAVEPWRIGHVLARLLWHIVNWTCTRADDVVDVFTSWQLVGDGNAEHFQRLDASYSWQQWRQFPWTSLSAVWKDNLCRLWPIHCWSALLVVSVQTNSGAVDSSLVFCFDML